MRAKNLIVTVALLCLISLTPQLVYCGESLQDAQVITPRTNCGVDSALALAEVTGHIVSASVREHILEANSAPTATLAQVKNMVAQVGVPVQGVKTTLQALLEKQRPSIIHLRAPDHFTLMLDGTPQWIRLMDGANGSLSVVPRPEIEERFDGFALQIADQAEINGPQAALQETDFQFGVRGVGQKAEHSFQITNAGQSDLKVNVRGSSCSCTAALLGDNADASEVTLQPGQSAPIRVTVEVRVVGSVQQMVTLATNDPARPLIYLTMRGTAPQNLEVSPQTLTFQVQQGETKDRVITLIGPPDFAVLDCTADAPTLSVTKQLISKDETRANWKIQVALASAVVGDAKALLTIKTNHPERPEITVPVAVSVRGDLQISPNAAFFGFIKKGERQRIELKLSSRSGQPFQILSAQAPANSGLQVEAPLKQAASAHTITVELDSSHVNFVEGELKLQTDSAKEPMLLIPVTALVENATVENALPGQTQAALLPRAEDDPNSLIAVAKPLVRVGQRAPDFSVLDTQGKQWKLSDLAGRKNVLLTFFPKCFTGGCANHLSSLRDHQGEFDNAQTQILAVSVDPAQGDKGQIAFARQWGLTFPLLPDTTRQLSMLYGAAQNKRQLAARMSVLIDKTGVVRWIDTDVHVESHGADVLAKINQLGLN